MTWLVNQIWPLLMLSAALGVATVVWWGQRPTTVEEWVQVPVAPEESEAEAARQAAVAAAAAEAAVAAAADQPVFDEPESPFPGLPAGGEPPPWQQEEVWSQPARLAGDATPRRSQDEWSDAAENWRSWADEATGKGYAEQGEAGAAPLPDRDRDLFAADRGHDGPVEAPATAPETDDPFPYAHPVEAAAAEPHGDEDDDDDDDDEAEAAEIRRLREQFLRGES